MKRFIPILLATLFVFAGLNARCHADAPVSFRQDIAPLLLDNCLACHGPKKSEGSYRVDTFEHVMSEGDSASPAFVTNDADASEAFRRITSNDLDERMPLSGDPLSDEAVALFRRWIDEGTRFDGGDPQAPLASIVPPPVHPDAPEVYPATVPITALVFNPDGQQLFVAGYNELTVWNPQDGTLIRRIGNVGERTYALAFSPDGKTLAVGSGVPGRLGEVRLFAPTDGTLTKVLTTTSDVVFDVAFNPAGDRLAVASADGVVRIIDLTTGETQRTITSHSDWVLAVAFSPDGSKLATASRDKTAKVFDAASGKLLITYAGHNEPVQGVAFHPGGTEVFSSAMDNQIHRWQIADGKKTATVDSFGGNVFKLTAAGAFCFSISADKTARQYELASHKKTRTYPGHSESVLSAAYHDGTKRLATGCFDGEVRIWNTQDGKPIVSFLAASGFRRP